MTLVLFTVIDGLAVALPTLTFAVGLVALWLQRLASISPAVAGVSTVVPELSSVSAAYAAPGAVVCRHRGIAPSVSLRAPPAGEQAHPFSSLNRFNGLTARDISRRRIALLGRDDSAQERICFHG